MAIIINDKAIIEKQEELINHLFDGITFGMNNDNWLRKNKSLEQELQALKDAK